jgi:hypothetical protein
MATTDWERRGWQAVVPIVIILIGALHLAGSAVVPVLFAMFLMLLFRRFGAATLARAAWRPRPLRRPR